MVFGGFELSRLMKKRDLTPLIPPLTVIIRLGNDLAIIKFCGLSRSFCPLPYGRGSLIEDGMRSIPYRTKNGDDSIFKELMTFMTVKSFEIPRIRK